MLTALAICVIVLPVASMVGTWLVASHLLSPPSEPPLVSRRVVVNLKSGTAVAGVVVTENAAHLVLKGCEVIEPGATAPTPADGEILIDRVHIDYIQAP